MIDFSNIKTEQVNHKSINFSSLTAKEAVELMNFEDLRAVECIRDRFEEIVKLIDLTTESLRKGGRLIYIGAGTSGRLGLLDASECPPTFGVDKNQVIGIIAGGRQAFTVAVEGAEDREDLGKKDLLDIGLSKEDTLIGITASGRTPYVIGALKYGLEIGANVGAVVCSSESLIAKFVSNTVELNPGPEVLTGSTRLKAGTVTKLVLNMISTISMKNIGKIYRNYMVDLKISNSKLRQRAINIIMAVTACNEVFATEKLEEAGGSVKLAIVMIALKSSCEEAKKIIDGNLGIIDNILEDVYG